ncbi:glycosyltransferase [Nocardiopsis alba]|uniref:Glycosyl transferases group 1 family protein n=1 Tax=Nocardiopsis alba (strain ATCC BAA-2165 / BE74) TaxID=1205910 RepID=J7LFU0_NOCAA|nr:glycosyltransferase [Nocardiopsis alba]AFR10315.1 glycosyl transferases group 1 family protein [Nocardiopsis alba ATCC BAA-2165]
MSTSFAQQSPTGPARIRAERGRRGTKVLIGTDTYPPDVNGAAYFTARLARGLVERGAEVHLLCPSPSGVPHVVVRDGVIEHRLRSMPSLAHESVRLALPPGVRGHLDRLLERLRPDAVHIQNHFLIGRMLARAAHDHDVPVIATNHFMPENLFDHLRVPRPLRPYTARLAWWDLGRVLSRVEHVTTPTPAAARLLLDQGFARPVEPVSCGIDLDRFHPLPARSALSERRRLRGRFGLADRTTMLFVGRLDEEKNADELIRSLAHTPDVQLALAGQGSHRGRLEELARAERVADRVVFLGFVAHEDLPDVYRCADVFTIASTAELQSIATLEAMASGLPIVAVDAMALPHLVEEGRNGYLYPPGSPIELAARVNAVVSDEAVRARLGEHSRSMAERHRLEDSLERFEAIYRRAGAIVPAQRGTT